MRFSAVRLAFLLAVLAAAGRPRGWQASAAPAFPETLTADPYGMAPTYTFEGTLYGQPNASENTGYAGHTSYRFCAGRLNSTFHERTVAGQFNNTALAGAMAMQYSPFDDMLYLFTSDVLIRFDSNCSAQILAGQPGVLSRQTIASVDGVGSSATIGYVQGMAIVSASEIYFVEHLFTNPTFFGFIRKINLNTLAVSQVYNSGPQTLFQNRPNNLAVSISSDNTPGQRLYFQYRTGGGTENRLGSVALDGTGYRDERQVTPSNNPFPNGLAVHPLEPLTFFASAGFNVWKVDLVANTSTRFARTTGMLYSITVVASGSNFRLVTSSSGNPAILVVYNETGGEWGWIAPGGAFVSTIQGFIPTPLLTCSENIAKLSDESMWLVAGVNSAGAVYATWGYEETPDAPHTIYAHRLFGAPAALPAGAQVWPEPNPYCGPPPPTPSPSPSPTASATPSPSPTASPSPSPSAIPPAIASPTPSPSPSPAAGSSAQPPLGPTPLATPIPIPGTPAQVPGPSGSLAIRAIAGIGADGRASLPLPYVLLAALDAYGADAYAFEWRQTSGPALPPAAFDPTGLASPRLNISGAALAAAGPAPAFFTLRLRVVERATGRSENGSFAFSTYVGPIVVRVPTSGVKIVVRVDVRVSVTVAVSASSSASGFAPTATKLTSGAQPVRTVGGLPAFAPGDAIPFELAGLPDLSQYAAVASQNMTVIADALPRNGPAAVQLPERLDRDVYFLRLELRARPDIVSLATGRRGILQQQQQQQPGTAGDFSLLIASGESPNFVIQRASRGDPELGDKAGQAITVMTAVSVGLAAASGVSSSLTGSNSIGLGAKTIVNSAQFAFYSVFFGGRQSAYANCSSKLDWTLLYFPLPFAAAYSGRPRWPPAPTPAPTITPAPRGRALLSARDIAASSSAEYSSERLQESLFYTGIITGAIGLLQLIVFYLWRWNTGKRPPRDFRLPRGQVVIAYTALEGLAIGAAMTAYFDAGYLGVTAAIIFVAGCGSFLAAAIYVSYTLYVERATVFEVATLGAPLSQRLRDAWSVTGRTKGVLLWERAGSCASALWEWLFEDFGEWQINVPEDQLEEDKRRLFSRYRFRVAFAVLFVDYRYQGLGFLFGVWCAPLISIWHLFQIRSKRLIGRDIAKKVCLAVVVATMATEEATSSLAIGETAVALVFVLVEQLWIVVGRPFRNRYDHFLCFVLNAADVPILICLRQAAALDPEDPFATTCINAAIGLCLAKSALLMLNQLIASWPLLQLATKSVYSRARSCARGSRREMFASQSRDRSRPASSAAYVYDSDVHRRHKNGYRQSNPNGKPPYQLQDWKPAVVNL